MLIRWYRQGNVHITSKAYGRYGHAFSTECYCPKLEYVLEMPGPHMKGFGTGQLHKLDCTLTVNVHCLLRVDSLLLSYHNIQ